MGPDVENYCDETLGACVFTDCPPHERLSDIRKRAIDLYKPPFVFYRGYIHDAEGNMVSDDEVDDTDGLHRIRGWGRIQKFEDAENLQDEVGHIIAEALTEYWNRHGDNGAGK